MNRSIVISELPCYWQAKHVKLGKCSYRNMEKSTISLFLVRFNGKSALHTAFITTYLSFKPQHIYLLSSHFLISP